MVKFKYAAVFASFIFLTLTDSSFAMKGDFDPEASGSSSLHFPGPQDKETSDEYRQAQALTRKTLKKYVEFAQWETAFELLERCGSQATWHEFFAYVLADGNNKGKISANDAGLFLHAYYDLFPFNSAQKEDWQVQALKRKLLEEYVKTAQLEAALTLLERCGSQDTWRGFFRYVFVNGEDTGENLCDTVLSIVRSYELFPSSPIPTLIGMLKHGNLISDLSSEDATLFLRTLLENSSADDNISIIQEAVCLHTLCNTELLEWGLTCLALCEGTIAEFQWNFLNKSFLFHQQESQAKKKKLLKKIVSKEIFALNASSLYVCLHMAQQIETQSDVINKGLREYVVDYVVYVLKWESAFHNAPQFDAYRPFLQQLFYKEFFDKKGRPLKKTSKYQAIYDLLFPS